MSAITNALFAHLSQRGGVCLAIGAVHVAFVYILTSSAPVQAVFDATPIEVSLVDAPAPAAETPPPPVPQLVPVITPSIEPPLITLNEEPPPNAITVAVAEAPPRHHHTGRAARRFRCGVRRTAAAAVSDRIAPLGEEGMVVLRVLINELGRADRIEIERSSGHARLDEAARIAVQRALFRPYIENGVARMALATIPIEFTWKSRRADKPRAAADTAAARRIAHGNVSPWQRRKLPRQVRRNDKTCENQPGQARARPQQPRACSAAECRSRADSPEVADLASADHQAGGAPIGAYREPLGGRAIMIASLPLDAVQPTPFQRDLSPTHVKRLAAKIDETGAFLDPLIVVRGEDGRLWTPNGRHRLAAAKVLGLKQITALISPNEALAYRILALNTEKAHNLKDRSLEVIRMARSLAKKQGTTREVGAQPPSSKRRSCITLGAVYEQAPALRRRRLQPVPEEGGSVQRPPARHQPARARGLRLAPAGDRCAGEDASSRTCTAKGFKSPYLRNYVVARINPVRFHKAKKGDTKPPMPIAQALTRMAAAAKKFDVKSVSNSDIAWVAVGAVVAASSAASPPGGAGPADSRHTS